MTFFKALLKYARYLQHKGWGRRTISIALQGYYARYYEAKERR